MSVVRMNCPLMSKHAVLVMPMRVVKGIEVTPQYVRFIENWAKVTYIVPPTDG